MKNNRIFLSPPHVGDEESENVSNAFSSNWISTTGPFIEEFEKDIANYCERKGACVVQSGTAAIHLATRLLGISKGDTVLCQSFTFIGSCNPVIYEKANLIFIDSENETWNMCPNSLRNALEDCKKRKISPKAIIVVHLYGMPAKMDEILSIASEYNVAVIEDAAEALGSKLNNKPCGSFGRLSILSFNGNKIITTSGGGALMSDSISDINEANFLSTQAKENKPFYEHKKIGYNYKLSNILASIGVAQLKILNNRVNKRRKNYVFYYELLKDVKGVTFLREPNGYFSNRWLTCILIDQKTCRISVDQIISEFEEEKIETRRLWKPMHMQPIFKNNLFYGSGVSNILFERGICLPSGSNMNEDDKRRIKNKLTKIFTIK
ncbi:MAG: pyridoxal phosphate-dependent aminotransferase [Flavobacteriaceae bacterium TMED200]|nr:pyridoxal phosphate-dependent aminotransferase [Flavobacteriaceae bacterium]OUW67134.1 MAG: pyridoxal phosphate-dependent aminotransferase [Flavobacteriaceae bacterium TMED200]